MRPPVPPTDDDWSPASERTDVWPMVFLFFFLLGASILASLIILSGAGGSYEPGRPATVTPYPTPGPTFEGTTP